MPGRAVVIVDDIEHSGVARRWRRCLRQNVIAEVPEFPPAPDVGNAIGSLLPSSRLKGSVLVAYSDALNFQRHARERFAAIRRRRTRGDR